MRDIVMTFTSAADALGRREFTLTWHDSERNRGQCFHAVPGPHIERLSAYGTVRIIEVRGAA
jgi:hypothetical protein